MPARPMTHSQLMRAREQKPATRTAADRGYDARWRKARRFFLRRNPLCLYCKRQGKDVLSTLIDHNPPHFGDMAKFWNVKTWTPCCTACHGFVTPFYDGGGGHPIRPRDGVYVAPEPGETVL